MEFNHQEDKYWNFAEFRPKLGMDEIGLQEIGFDGIYTRVCTPAKHCIFIGYDKPLEI